MARRRSVYDTDPNVRFAECLEALACTSQSSGFSTRTREASIAWRSRETTLIATHERTGHLFEARFALRAIDDEAYLHDVCAYVLANPVRAGLCKSVDDWPWSAQASYVGAST